MRDQIGYLPTDLDSRLRLRTVAMQDSETAWEIHRLTEAAYARGMHDGYLRGTTDTAMRADADEARRSASHEDTCAARRKHPRCACANPPPGVDHG